MRKMIAKQETSFLSILLYLYWEFVKKAWDRYRNKKEEWKHLQGTDFIHRMF